MLVLSSFVRRFVRLPSPETSSRQSHARFSSKRAAKLLVAPFAPGCPILAVFDRSRIESVDPSRSLALSNQLPRGPTDTRHWKPKPFSNGDSILSPQFINGQGIAGPGIDRSAFPHQTAAACGFSVASR
jgi:hypothetical protein